MLRQRLIHPGILGALAAAGHGSTVLISDGNFPHATGPTRSALHVYLNLAPDRLRVTEVLEVLASAIPIEAATLMEPDERAPGDPDPAAHAAVVELLDGVGDIRRVGRTAFYVLTRSDDLALVVATGDVRPYANVLLTIGVVTAAD
jgi:L-fucose mutarotase